MMFLLEAVSRINLHYLTDILIHDLSYDVFFRNYFLYIFLLLIYIYINLWSVI
jgi:hypothetical protein